MSTYNTTEGIRNAIHELEEGDIIKVPQYANPLEVEHLGELNGETNAYVGVRFADPHKRTSATKNIILNQHSGRAYLAAGTTDKGAVKVLEVRKPEPVGTLVTEADDSDEDDERAEPEPIAGQRPEDFFTVDEDEDEDAAAPEPDAFGHDELIEVESTPLALIGDDDEESAEYVDVRELAPADDDGPEFDESHHILGDGSPTPFEVEQSRPTDEGMESTEREVEERSRTFEEDYRHQVMFVAECIIEEIEADMGEDFETVTRNDLPNVAEDDIHETVAFHEYTTESRHYLNVIEASPADPDACSWQNYVDFEDSPDADDVFGAMAHVVFRQDIRDALRGEF